MEIDTHLAEQKKMKLMLRENATEPSQQSKKSDLMSPDSKYPRKGGFRIADDGVRKRKNVIKRMQPDSLTDKKSRQQKPFINSSARTEQFDDRN